MRRKVTRRVLLAIVVMGPAMFQAGACASERAAASPKAVVRVYPDWRTDPKLYVSLTVPLERLDIRPNAVRREYARSEAEGAAQISLEGGDGEAILVVMPQDQQDQAVSDAMKGLICAELLRRGTLTLRPDQTPPAQAKPLQFVDASGQPLANAEVAVLIGQSEYVSPGERPQAWIGNVQLDEEGRLMEPPRSNTSLGRLMFYVMHPDCGPVPAMPQGQDSSQPYNVFRAAALPKEQWCVFLDALGRPMAGAWVEVVTSGSWTQGQMTAPAPIRLDEKGRLRPPEVFTTLARCSFVVSDPNCGLALIQPNTLAQMASRTAPQMCVAPLAPYGSRADAGSIWGIVIDSEGTAIPGAVISCKRAIAPNGGQLTPSWLWIAQADQEARVLTDEQGRFAMCLPQMGADGRLGALVPRGSAYEVTVTPPNELGCQPFQGRLQVGMEHTIALEGKADGPKKYEGVLAFEDERGMVTDPEKIARINLVIRVRPGNLPMVSYGYPRGEWLEKSKLPFGIYSATADWDGKHYTFRRVMVRPDSPEVTVFKPYRIEPYETRYRGRVVHGTSGDPIAGAIILPADAAGIDTTCLDSQALSRLEQQAGPQTVRTDVGGRFEIALPIAAGPGSEDALVALKSDYLAFRRQASPSRGGTVTVPELKLFPAGTLVLEPNVPAAQRGKRIALDFLIPPGSPAWLASLWAPAEQNSGGTVIFGGDVRGSGRQSLRVPAYAKLTLRLQLADERYAPAFLENVTVGQGKTLDLGRIDFVRAVTVAVKVVDPNDGPLPGMTVTCLTGRAGCPAGEAVTDANGLARLRIADRSAGWFVAEHKDPETKNTIRGRTSYDLADPEGASKEFTLRLPGGLEYPQRMERMEDE